MLSSAPKERLKGGGVRMGRGLLSVQVRGLGFCFLRLTTSGDSIASCRLGETYIAQKKYQSRPLMYK